MKLACPQLELEWVELGYFMVEDNNNKAKQQQLIDFRGYPSPQLELELSWQVGAKVAYHYETEILFRDL